MMDIQDFLDLDLEKQEELLKIHHRRVQIRRRRESIAKEQEDLNSDLASLQESCNHIASTKTSVCNEDDYGRRTQGGTHSYKCPDCGKYWSTEYE
jgi:transposase-like protein